KLLNGCGVLHKLRFHSQVPESSVDEVVILAVVVYHVDFHALKLVKEKLTLCPLALIVDAAASHSVLRSIEALPPLAGRDDLLSNSSTNLP
ncbi:MAG: hypothetical protein XD48_2087, partial [Archaeoglobus fulgidus]